MQVLETFLGGLKSFPVSYPMIFTCKRLVKLKPRRDLDLILPTHIFLPNLKVLYLEGFKLVAEYPIKRHFQGFPLLEELYLLFPCHNRESECNQVEALDISIP